MLVSWELLKDFIDMGGVTPDEAAERLTLSGAEIEYTERTAADMKGVVSARIAVLEKHPTKPGHLSVAHMDVGGGKQHICVTAAPNMKQGDIVFYAPAGSVLPGGVELGRRDFDGTESDGMMLSAAELGLPDIDSPDGLLILPNDTPVGAEAGSLFHIADTLLDVSITPNRGDLLSLIGMARELHGLFPGSKLRTPAWMEPLRQDEDWTEEFGTISLPDRGCLNYRLGLATGAKIGPSPMTVRVDLSHLGMRPISNAVDVTNYVMLTMGQPLHAFDLNTLPAREITVRSAANGETMMTLDGKDRVLTEKDMLITSGGEAIAIAGVMGGEQTGIKDDTSTIVVESACFSPVRVGHTSRRLGIGSEAAFRFARTVDPTLSSRALAASLTLLGEWCGAKVNYRQISAENESPKPKPVKLTKKKLSTILSFDDMDKAQSIIEGFGIAHTGGSGDERTFMPPSWRPDISIEEDLIEEVGRYMGYNESPNALPGELPRRADVGAYMHLAAFVRQVLISRGYSETVTYSFLPEDFPAKLYIPSDDIRAHPMTLANPISREQTAMRTTLVHGLLTGLRTSLASGWRGSVRIFEQGRVFLRKSADSDEHIENETAAGLVFGGADPRTPWKGQEEDFFSVKADVEAIIGGRGFPLRFVPSKEPFTHAGQTAEIRVITPDGERRAGWIGRLKPAIEQELDSPGAVYMFEIDMAVIEEAQRPNLTPASQFPASLRDISLLAPRDRSADDVAADIRAAVREASGENILETLRLFDVYSGKNIPDGFRSMAYSLNYRAEDRTLRDGEADSVHMKVRDILKEKGYNIR